MITKLKTLVHSALSGVTIRPLDTKLERGRPQKVLVQMAPNTTIPLHTHKVDANMFCVVGEATVLSANDDDNGRSVQAGNLVAFKANVAHGFKAGESGFAFVSENGGIVDETGHWDIAFA